MACVNHNAKTQTIAKMNGENEIVGDTDGQILEDPLFHSTQL